MRDDIVAVGRRVFLDILCSILIIVLIGGIAFATGEAMRKPKVDLSTVKVPSMLDLISSGKIRVLAFEKLRQENELLILDVRSVRLFELGTIPGAESAPAREVVENAEVQMRWVKRSQEVFLTVVICGGKGCEDSARVARLLRKQGASRVCYLDGGFSGWAERFQ